MGKQKSFPDSFDKDSVHYADLLPKPGNGELLDKLIKDELKIDDFIPENDLAQLIFDHLPGIIYLTDFPSLSVLWLNFESFKTLGYNEDQIKKGGPHFFKEILHPDDLGVVAGVIDFFQNRKGKFFRSAYRLRHVDGHYVWYYGTSTPLKKHPNGDPMLLIGIAIDIFSQIQTDQKLRALLHENLQLRNKLVINSLTKRHKEIMLLIAKGKTSKEIAKNLNISSLTVETHRKNILKKLDIHNTAELVKFTIENFYPED